MSGCALDSGTAVSLALAELPSGGRGMNFCALVFVGADAESFL